MALYAPIKVAMPRVLASVRSFNGWQKQPQQQHDENTERVALQRRLEPDDC